MKNRPRPHIPLAIRIKVIERQIAAAGKATVVFVNQPADKQLADLLTFFFGAQPVALDHDPPLRVRPYNPRIKNVAARYTPNANDPDHLIYRTVVDHRLKTNVRGDGAQFPDRVLIKRERKREKKARPSKADRFRKIAGKPINIFKAVLGPARTFKIPARANPWPPRGSRPLRG